MQNAWRTTTTNIFSLKILNDTAQCALGSTQRPIQHVNVNLARLILAFETTSHLQASALCKNQKNDGQNKSATLEY
jgi:hypothetical protein